MKAVIGTFEPLIERCPLMRKTGSAFVLVTNEGTMQVNRGELDEAGALFYRNGAPRNLPAWLLMDFCGLYLAGVLDWWP